MIEQPDLFQERPPHVYTVREINESVRRTLEGDFGDIHVEGEISNAKLQSSGHWYFTLKDDSAQLAAVLFRADAARVRFRLENGLAVRASGRITVYAPQGRLQLVVRDLVPVGQGPLELAFRQLKDKLQAEGLFDAARKRPLPRFPRRIALVTSPTGAAVRDMLTTVAARWPLVRVFVLPVAVQGEQATGDIVRALERVNRVRCADVIIVARGGGGLEDLWAFNDEAVARAIFGSSIPVVSGIGHEVDFTIADFVADQRAATPTAAAALVVPHRDEIHALLLQLDRRMARALRRRLELPQQRLGTLLQSYGMRRLRALVPELAQTLDDELEALEKALKRQLENGFTRLDASSTHLLALGPRRVLERGYAFCTDAPSGEVVGRAAQTHSGQRLVVHFADDERTTEVLGSGQAG